MSAGTYRSRYIINHLYSFASISGYYSVYPQSRTGVPFIIKLNNTTVNSSNELQLDLIISEFFSFLFNCYSNAFTFRCHGFIDTKKQFNIQEAQICITA